MKPNIEDGICPTKRRLGEEFAESARLYYEAVARLTQQELIQSCAAQQLRTTAAETHLRTEAARLALEQHLNSHGC
jgi:hypothetical protein